MKGRWEKKTQVSLLVLVFCDNALVYSMFNRFLPSLAQ